MAFGVSSPFKTALVALVLGCGIVSVPAAHATDATDAAPKEALRVTLDRAKVLRTEKSAKTVIIGNPMVMDATVQDSRTIVLTGRSFGVTNLVILDALGEPILDETVVVGAQEANTVRIYRRASRETLACSPVCEPTLTIGDSNGQFKDLAEQVQLRNGLSAPQR